VAALQREVLLAHLRFYQLLLRNITSREYIICYLGNIAVRDISFVFLLINDLMVSQIQKNTEIGYETRVQVKIGGDGARFSHTLSFILFSFSFPVTAKNVLSEHGK